MNGIFFGESGRCFEELKNIFGVLVYATGGEIWIWKPSGHNTPNEILNDELGVFFITRINFSSRDVYLSPELFVPFNNQPHTIITEDTWKKLLEAAIPRKIRL